MIYLDNAATTPLSDSVKDLLKNELEYYANPSSLYEMGHVQKNKIEDARDKVKKFINGYGGDIIFTGGGSSSNTLAIIGYGKKHQCVFFYSRISHTSMVKAAETRNVLFEIKVDSKGNIDFDTLEKDMQSVLPYNNPFVMIDYANSELGTIQDVKRLIQLVHKYNGIVYLDCTGSISSIPLNVKELDVDMAGFSGHKIGALKGIGVLYKKKEIQLQPLVYGNQEYGLYGGTENTLGILSLGFAIDEFSYDHITDENRNYLWNHLKTIPNTVLIGAEGNNRLKKNLYVCFKGINAEALTIQLDMKGIMVSTGSACSNYTPNTHTLDAIGFPDEDKHSCIRFTLSGYESKEDLDYVIKTVTSCVKNLRNLNGTN